VKYRFYVDEVGNSDLGASHDPNHRYLSLTGVIMELGYVDATVFPALEALKRKYFGSHPDEPIILHRKELVNKKQSFSVLNDPAVEGAFNAELIALLQNLEYVVITAVIDKLEHKQRYQVWQNDPYHYCLTVLVERYALWLRAKGAVGDVMAESRGKKEDQRLAEVFAEIHANGSEFVGTDVFAAHLTSKQLKIKSKSNNIAGLQLADLLAHPSYRATLARQQGTPLLANFGGEIAAILEHSKYNRGPEGRIEGWGRELLP